MIAAHFIEFRESVAGLKTIPRRAIVDEESATVVKMPTAGISLPIPALYWMTPGRRSHMTPSGVGIGTTGKPGTVAMISAKTLGLAYLEEKTG